MKKILNSGFSMVMVIIILSGCITTSSISQGPVSASITYQTFYDDLSPYGNWIDYPAYGHVWHPMISGAFRPYLTNGYWNYSGDGMFYSEFNFTKE